MGIVKKSNGTYCFPQTGQLLWEQIYFTVDYLAHIVTIFIVLKYHFAGLALFFSLNLVATKQSLFEHLTKFHPTFKKIQSLFSGFNGTKHLNKFIKLHNNAYFTFLIHPWPLRMFFKAQLFLYLVLFCINLLAEFEILVKLFCLISTSNKTECFIPLSLNLVNIITYGFHVEQH